MASGERSPTEPQSTPPPRDAATLIVLRPSKVHFEVFMVKRHAKSGFMASAHVFPGGVIEDDDLAIAAYCDGRDALSCGAHLAEPDHGLAMRAHVAALRETFEETAMLLGGPAIDEARRTKVRDALNDGTLSFANVLDEFDARLDLTRLHALARWVTPKVERRRYDTHFFVTVADAAESGVHDARETIAGEWFRPEIAIDASRRGELILPPPTLHTLLLLAENASIDALLASCGPPPRIEPVFTKQAFPTLALPGDALHPQSQSVLPGPTRFELRDGRWQAP